MFDEAIYAPDSSNKHFLGYLPNISGSFSISANAGSSYNPGFTNISGAFVGETYTSSQGGGGGNNHNGYKKLGFYASRSSETYGKGGLTYNNVIPASISVKEIIKYI